MNKIVYTIILFFLSSCFLSVFNDGKVHQFKMVGYMSKFWIYDYSVHSLKIYPSNNFEIIVNGKVEYKGRVEHDGDSLVFNAIYFQMPAAFLDSQKNILGIYKPGFVDIEGEYSEFKKVQ